MIGIWKSPPSGGLSCITVVLDPIRLIFTSKKGSKHPAPHYCDEFRCSFVRNIAYFFLDFKPPSLFFLFFFIKNKNSGDLPSNATHPPRFSGGDSTFRSSLDPAESLIKRTLFPSPACTGSDEMQTVFLSSPGKKTTIRLTPPENIE